MHLSSPWCCRVSIAIVPGSLCCRSGGALCYFVQSNHKITLRPVCRARGDRWRRAAQGRHGARRLGSQQWPGRNPMGCPHGCVPGAGALAAFLTVTAHGSLAEGGSFPPGDVRKQPVMLDPCIVPLWASQAGSTPMLVVAMKASLGLSSTAGVRHPLRRW